MKPNFQLPDAKTLLAFGITTVVVLGIIILSISIVITADTGVNTRAQSVLTTVLPLFGTWVGTVLAYYFSRENFESASKSTQELVRQLTPEEKLRSILVVNVMIKDIFSKNNLQDKVEDTLKDLSKKGVKRLLILNSSGALLALLYLEGILGYLYNLQETERPKKTLNDLLTEKPELKQTPAFVGKKTTLADAKDAMRKIEKCKVIIVTQSGNSDEPVIGLLTNTDIAKHSNA